MADLIGTYRNGNYKVFIYDDGTKFRVNGLDYLLPDFPESMDLKICNRCNMGCPMCHEQSTVSGDLGDLNAPFLKTLHPFTELAIGGGNPLEHPDLEDFLVRMKDQGVLCSMTVHFIHFLENIERLERYCDSGLIHGLGISVHRAVSSDEIKMIKQFPNAVIHLIAGITPDDVFESLFDHGLKLLILGYKNYGRGCSYLDEYPDIYDAIGDLHDKIISFGKHFDVISFDNLAIKQLDVRSLVGEDVWNKSYMGDDGEFTMYADLVKYEYAISSTSERRPITSDSIDEMFSSIRSTTV